MDKQRIEEIEAARAKMTKGNWIYFDDDSVYGGQIHAVPKDHETAKSMSQITDTPEMDDRPDDMKGICLLVNTADEALAEIKRLQGESEERRVKAAFYEGGVAKLQAENERLREAVEPVVWAHKDGTYSVPLIDAMVGLLEQPPQAGRE